MHFYRYFILLVCIAPSLFAQQLTGRVFEIDDHNHKVPLVAANVYWEGTTIGAATDAEGYFRIKKTGKDAANLIVSYIGYQPDTITVANNRDSVEIVLSLNRELQEVVVSAELSSKFYDELSALPIEVLTSKELLKAACCNLGESFTTNASVDVQYQDAVTGARQIQLLGLAGTYTQMLFENIPALTGLGSTFGLGFVPGPWISAISISKGSASVVNGYESITGQINIGYKSPTESERYYFNAFQSSHLKTDLNANVAYDFSDHLSTILLAHSNFTAKSFDDNGDSFADQPKTTQYNIMNRWQYVDHSGYEAQLGIQYLAETRNGGQLHAGSNGQRYPIEVDSRHLEVSFKNGYVFNSEPYTSIGLQLNGHFHDQNSLFGIRDYDAIQNSFFAKLIFETATSDNIHKITMGGSYTFDQFRENLNTLEQFRKESRPGVFAEYTFSPDNLLSIVPGIRVDFHNLYGTFVTPRIHAKYSIDEHTTLRASAGKGYRSVHLLSDNLNYFASSRTFTIIDQPDYEEAWNYGFNLTRYFPIGDHELRITADFYRTDFVRQTVVDIDSDIRKVQFYLLNGDSYSNSYQIEAAYELFQGFEMTAAYRFTDVKATYNNKLLTKPLHSRYKVLTTFSYANDTRDWVVDASFLVNGPGRIPSTSANPVQYQRDDEYPSFVNINAQITKRFDLFELYIGAENLTDFRQLNPIIAADDPFGQYFDASMIWGPMEGRKFYAGIRITVF